MKDPWTVRGEVEGLLKQVETLSGDLLDWIYSHKGSTSQGERIQEIEQGIKQSSLLPLIRLKKSLKPKTKDQ